MNKSAEQYIERKQQFDLDAAWINLKQKADFKEAVKLFQNSDVDPRELILLFKDLYDLSTSIRKHVVGVPQVFLRNYLHQHYMQGNPNQNPDVERKYKEAREEIRRLLEIINSKYVAELRKDPNKDAEFMISQFSDIEKKINKEKQKLKDILSLVQMAIIKLYVDTDNNGDMESKVQDFFNEMTFGQNSKIAGQIDYRQRYLFLDEAEMQEFLRQGAYQHRKITRITQALILEYVEKKDSLETALELWQKMQSEQGCERTVAILQKLKEQKYVDKYAKWVFQMNPDIGMKLFTDG